MIINLINQSHQILSDINEHKILAFIEAVGRTCYKSEDKITDESAKRFVKMIVDSGHHSVIEHVNVTVKFITSRGISHELVRHRLCSISQESSRYVNYRKKGLTFIIPYWSSLKPGKYNRVKFAYSTKFTCDDDNMTANDEIWLNSIFDASYSYYQLLSKGLKPQDARCVLPHSLKTELVMTANLREWLHIFNVRTSKAAHPEMVSLMSGLLHDFRKAIPVVYGN